MKLPKLPFGEGSMSLRKDGLIMYRKTFKLNDDSRVKKTVYGSTPQECMRKMKEVEGSINKGEKKNEKTLIDAMNEWLKYKEKELKPQSFRRLNSTVNYTIGNSDIAHYRYQTLSYDEIQKVIDDYNEKGYAHSSIKKIYEALNAFYKYVTIRDKFDNPMILVNIPRASNIKKETKTVEFFDQEDIDKFITEAGAKWKTGNPRYQGGLLFAANIYLGMRIGELLALQWKDIDLNKNTIYVSKTLIEETNPDYDKNIPNSKKTRFTVQNSNKTSKNRYVPINSKAKNLLLQYKEVALYTDDEDFVLSTRNRKTTTIKNATDTIQTIEANAETKIQKSGTHILRHTCASLYFRAGVPIETIAKILGHSVDVCRETYIHFVEEQLKDAASKIDVIEI